MGQYVQVLHRVVVLLHHIHQSRYIVYSLVYFFQILFDMLLGVESLAALPGEALYKTTLKDI